MKNIEENMSKKIFVLDTCSIGKFCNDQDFKIEELTNIQLAYLSIQVDEIENCPSDDRKKRLLKSLKLLESRSLSSVVMDISNWDDSYFEDETNVDYYEIIKEYQINKYPRKNIDNIARDALIASTCLNLNYNLITEDTGLREKFKELNPNLICLNWEDFKRNTCVNSFKKNTDNIGIKKSKSTFNIYKYIKKRKKRSILNYLKLRFKIYKRWVRNQYKTLDENNIANVTKKDCIDECKNNKNWFEAFVESIIGLLFILFIIVLIIKAIAWAWNIHWFFGVLMLLFLLGCL